jgi:pilus assembly protein CpaD
MQKSHLVPNKLPRAAALAGWIGLAVMLGACTHTETETTASVPVDYRQRHPITVQEADHSIDIFVGTGRGGLTATQRAEVMAFAQTWLREGTGGITVDLPVATPNARTAADTLHEVQAVFAAAGVPARGIAVRKYSTHDPKQMATLKLSYPKITADAGPCGLWPEDLGPSAKNPIYLTNRPYWNLGCAYQRNMAAMVAEPSDLIQPRAETPSYTKRRAKVFDSYSKGESTATQNPDSDKGKISDVGK